MARLRLLVLLGLLYLHTAVADVYQVFITSGFSGTTDKVSIILVGQGGAQTRVHDLPGTFPRNSVKSFRITDRGVGAISAVKIRLTQKGLWQDFWYLEQVIVVASGKYFTFFFKSDVKYNQWNVISPKCRKGFRKLPDGTCVDIDECKDSGGCRDKVATCHNTIGSFTCSCPFGYNTDYQGGCQDVNECRRNNGQCQELCHNSPGSYRCDCYRSGYKLVDGRRCVDIDECSEGKDNCDRVSTTCINSPGSFACYCKRGYSRKDASSCERKTCPSFSADRDSHGTLKPARCFQQGQNKYQDRCTLVCDHGYVPYTPSAVNATCGPYKNWVPHPTTCIGRPCPKLVNIDNGYVEWGCRNMIRRYGQRCQHTCNSGYKLKGNAFRECQADGTWSGSEPTCERVYKKPEIDCPPSITVILKPGMNTSDVSNKWTRPTALYAVNITAVDPPGVNSNYRFPPGTTSVKWVAVNAVGKEDSCVVQVKVLDREKPKVVFCPERIFKVYYGSGPVWVNMTKPVFTDNVGIVRYDPPLIDGVFTSGHHNFFFKAYDAAGNSAQCKVTVYVGGYRCQLPPEGPPDGKWICSTFGQVRWCNRACAPGQKLFGAYSYWMCNSVTGKWQRAPQPGPVRHCVGYTNVNASLLCAVGSVRNTSSGYPGCFECPIGTYYHNNNCEACAKGMFQDQTGQTSCKSCPSGTSSFKGSWNCKPVCPPGRYSKNGLGPFCDFCSNGTYQDKQQQTSCIQCPSGTYTLHIGATFCGKSPKISKVEPGSSVSVSAGGNAVLKCLSDGVPTPSVYWQYPANGKGSKTQSPMEDKDGKLLGTQLSITNAGSSDDGTYTCVSANAHGEITRSVQVIVTKPSSKRATLEDIDMTITMDERTLRAANDQCPAGKYSSSGLGPLCRVCPKDTYQDQAGMTSCKNCTSGTETLQLAAASPADCGVAPTIKNVSSSVNKTSREAMLDCYANGSPSPLVTWYFTEDVPGDFLGLPKLEQLVDDKGKPTGTRMIIRAVKRFNTGRYECTAVNPHGQDKKTLDLDVWQI